MILFCLHHCHTEYIRFCGTQLYHQNIYDYTIWLENTFLWTVSLDVNIYFLNSFCLTLGLNFPFFPDAADVAFDLMLQEDFSHPISKALSWYACHLYWKNPPPPAEAAEEAEEDVSSLFLLLLLDYDIRVFFKPLSSETYCMTTIWIKHDRQNMLRSWSTIEI